MDGITDYDQLAELESLLYSQIHHSVDTEPPPQTECPKPPKLVQNVYTPPRYFDKNQPAPAVPNTSVSAPQNPTNNLPCAAGGNIAKNDRQIVHIHQPVQFKMPQFCQPQVNNIVIIPSNLAPMTRQERQKFNKQMKKSHEMTIQQAAHNAEVFRCLNNEDRVKALKIQKRQRYLARRKEKKKLLKEQQLIEAYNNSIAATQLYDYQPIEPMPTASTSGKMEIKTAKSIGDVIELSETDEDEVILLNKSIETVVLSSDEDCQMNLIKTAVESAPSIVNEGDDSSVQLVELAAPETIVLDAEPELPARETRSDAMMMKPPSDTTSTTSSVLSAAPANDKSANKVVTPTKSAEQMAGRYDELVNTPESSNDFLDQALDVSQSNFNFSLHGNDMAGEKSFLKPRNLAAAYENESSCSTSDISSLKNPVFNELEFESPAIQLFDEADLGSFSDFITPKRKDAIASLLTSCAVGYDQESGPSTDVLPRTSTDSESSSESEFEDDTRKVTKQPKRKRLPSLSHFDVDDNLTKSSTLISKAERKKVVKAANKFDFIKDAVAEEARTDQSTVESARTTEKEGKKRKQKEKVQDKGSEVNEDLSVSTKKRKRQKASKSDTEGQNSKNVLVEEKDHEASMNEQSNEDGNVSNVSEIEKRSSKKKKKRKSKGDAILHKGPEYDSNKSSTPKRKSNTKSDNEVDDDDGRNTKNKNCNENEIIVDTESVSPAKRKKRKSKSECTVDETQKKAEPDAKDTGSPAAVRINSQIEESENVDEADRQSEANQSDVQIIDVPVECIDVSSDDDCDDLHDDKPSEFRFRDSGDDDEEESHFDGEELANFHTDIDLSNVRSFYVDSVVSNDATSNKEPLVVAGSSAVSTGDKGHKTWCTPGFDIDTALAQMSSDPKKWQVMERDRIRIPLSAADVRCKRCREFGHKAFRCTRQMRCWLCGESEHQEPRCPNAICTNCGRSTRFFTFNCGRCCYLLNQRCDFCNSKGHLKELCPDVWRRYHLTVEPTAPVVSIYGVGDKMLKDSNERWCSGCAKPFHFEASCNYYNRTHNRAPSFVHKYKDVYNLPPAASRKTRAAPIRGPVWKPSAALAQTQNLLSEPKLKPELRRVTRSQTTDARETLTGGFQILNLEKHLEELEQGAQERKKKKSGADVDVDVQHKRIEVAHSMSREALELLDTPRGSEFLKSLFDEFSITYAFDGSRIKLFGFPTDLLKVTSTLKCFLIDPKMTSITMHATNRIKTVFKANCALLEEWAKKFNVKQALDLKSHTFCLQGDDVFNILQCRHQVLTFIANIKSYRITQILKMPPYSIEAQEHPYANELARKLNVQWKITGHTFTFTGVHGNIQIVKRALMKPTKSHVATLPVLKQAKEILKHAEYPHDLTAELVTNMIRVGDYCALNSILLRGHHSFKKVEKLGSMVAAQCFIEAKMANGFQPCIKYFHVKRPEKFYLEKLNELKKKHNVQKCKNVIIDPTTFDINLPEQQFQHILNADEGKEVLSQIGRHFTIVVMSKESRLRLHCNADQAKKAEEQLKFYFLILGLEFPNDPVWIYKELTRCLAAAKLNYYASSCQALFSLMCMNEGDCQIKKDLHGLLFTKYEFLDGHQHKNVVMQYVHSRHSRKSLPTSEYIRIKLSAMYLFCPVAMTIDYKTLAAMAPSPPIIPIAQDQLKNAQNQIKNAVQFGLDNEEDGLKIAEYQAISEYLERNKFSNEAFNVAKMFLGEDALK